jgi:ABC-type antimicrobial peptide transport system permease subunit
MVLREGALLCAVALAVGLPAALGLTRVLSTQLYGVSPYAPSTFAIVVALLVAAAMVASYIPVRHAAKIDPLEALRHE